MSGFKTAMTRATNQYAKSKNLLKDIESGLSGTDLNGGVGGRNQRQSPAASI